MWNKPTEEELNKLPKLYATENMPEDDKEVLMHFFIGGSDWYVAEYSPEKRIFFGFVIMNGDLEMAEWGYSSLDEMSAIKFIGLEIDHDLYWKPKKFREVRADLEKRYGRN